VRRRLRFTAKRLGLKPDCLIAASISSRVLGRTDDGSLKYFDTVGRENPTHSEKSSMQRIVFRTSLRPVRQLSRPRCTRRCCFLRSRRVNWNVLISQDKVWPRLPLLQRFQDVPPAPLALVLL